MLVGEVFARMGLNSKQYEKDLSRLEGETKKRALTLGNIFKGALSVTIGMTMFEAVKRGFQTVVGESISFNAQMEQARIGFTTMLGSAERAEAFLRDMADFAARTPFEFPELLDASKRMLAYGFAAEDVLPTMEAVGNASAAVGLGTEGINRIILALGQMRAKGKLSAEEMRQLTETGIPAWEILAEAMNKTTAEIMDMQQKGLIPADEAIQTIIEGMNKRFPGMMKNMENTWEGVTSTIKDVWRMTIGAVTQNLFQGLVSWLQGVRDFATNFYDTFQRYGLQRAISESFGPEVAALVSVLGATLRGFASVVSAVTGFITQYGKQIRFVAVVMGTYLVLLKTVTLAKWLAVAATTALTNSQLLLAGQSSATTGIIGFLSNVITFYKVQMLTASATTNVFTGALVKLRAALYAVHVALGPIGWAILGISAAVAGGTALWNKYTQSLQKAVKTASPADLAKGFGDLEKSTKKSADATEEQADALTEARKAANKNLQSFDEVHTLQEDMSGSAEDLADSLGLGEIEAPGDIGGLEIPDIGSQLEQMKPTLAGFWNWIKKGFGNLVDWIKNTDAWQWLSTKWSALNNIADTAWNGTLDIISTAMKGMGNVIKTTWQEVCKFLVNYWQSLGNLATDVFGAIRYYIVGTWDNIKKTASDIWGAIWGLLKNQWETIKTFAINIFGTVRDLILGKIDLRTAVKQIWGEIKSFFINTWNNIKDSATNIWTALGNFFKTQWELSKGLVINIWTAIKEFLLENWKAIKDAAINIWDAIETFFNDTWESIKKAVVDYWTAILTFLGLNWEDIKTAAKTAWEGIKKNIVDPMQTAWNWLKTTWDEIAISLERTWEGIKETARDVWGGVATVIKGAVNGIIGFINKFIRGWNKIELKVPEVKIPLVGTVGGWTVRVPRVQEIPLLAKGGLVTAPTLAMLGEAGPEAVIPLGRSGFAGDLADTVAQAVYRAIMDAARISQASAGGDDREIVLKIDNTALARMQLPAIIREGQRQGLNLVVQPQGV